MDTEIWIIPTWIVVALALCSLAQALLVFLYVRRAYLISGKANKKD